MKKDKAFDVFKKQLKEHGMFLTFERKVVCDEVFGVKRHFSAEELVKKLRNGQRRVSRSTIYKTLILLKKMGFIKRIQHNNRKEQYEYIYGEARHGHLLCECCGQIIEFRDKAIEDLENKINKKHKFISRELTLKLTGLCHNCQN